MDAVTGVKELGLTYMKVFAPLFRLPLIDRRG
jgi:hypothetical protein